MQVVVSREIVFSQLHMQESAAIAMQYSVWRAMSSIGFIVGSLSLLIHALGIRR